jgi:hypothetical protein
LSPLAAAECSSLVAGAAALVAAVVDAAVARAVVCTRVAAAVAVAAGAAVGIAVVCFALVIVLRWCLVCFGLCLLQWRRCYRQLVCDFCARELAL